MRVEGEQEMLSGDVVVFGSKGIDNRGQITPDRCRDFVWLASPMDSLKIPLPKFLKLLTSNNVPVPKAMAVSGKMYEYAIHAAYPILIGLDTRISTPRRSSLS